jgi:hypothetical protein
MRVYQEPRAVIRVAARTPASSLVAHSTVEDVIEMAVTCAQCIQPQ